MLGLRTIVAWLVFSAEVCGTSWTQAFNGYTRRVWQGVDGLPEQTVQAFAHTADGYL